MCECVRMLGAGLKSDQVEYRVKRNSRVFIGCWQNIRIPKSHDTTFFSLFDILSIVSEFYMWNIPCTSNICTSVTVMANQHRISLLKAFYLALTLTGTVFCFVLCTGVF